TCRCWTVAPLQRGPGVGTLSGGSGGSGGGGGPGPASGVLFSSAGHTAAIAPVGVVKRPANLRWTNSNQSKLSGISTGGKRIVVFDPPEDDEKPKPVFTHDFIKQLVAHVHVYAELLFRWQMYDKRIQLLKTVNKRNHVKEENKGVYHQIGIVQTCTHCGHPLYDNSLECHACHVPRTMALCSICRLPVKGLSVSAR
ncbi:hypothetical protein P691DRAFT_810331, partial [Macrolepiota fuliginosa MF-IS2]